MACVAASLIAVLKLNCGDESTNTMLFRCGDGCQLPFAPGARVTMVRQAVMLTMNESGCDELSTDRHN